MGNKAGRREREAERERFGEREREKEREKQSDERKRLGLIWTIGLNQQHLLMLNT